MFDHEGMIPAAALFDGATLGPPPGSRTALAPVPRSLSSAPALPAPAPAPSAPEREGGARAGTGGGADADPRARALRDATPGATGDGESNPDRIAELQKRIEGMQRNKVDGRPEPLPTLPELAALLPGGGVLPGSVYTVENSPALALALMAGPSAAGAWCGAVGVPGFGAEAAEQAGIALDRLVLVPEPGDQWLRVTAALADVLGVILVAPPRGASAGDVARLDARLRQRGAVLISLGEWPGADARLRVSEQRWAGLGDGHGLLRTRRTTLEIATRANGMRPRRAGIWRAGRAA